MIGNDYPSNWGNDKDEWWEDWARMEITGITNISKRERFGVMQFTGLQDKNGKDIYEGDILTITDSFHTYRMPVIWHRDYWTLKDDGTYGTLSEWNQTSEVIGNIYQTPELLTT